MSSLSGNFSYAFIPANEEEPIEAREGDKSGGLSDDILIKTAKDYFFQQSGGDSRVETLDNASPEERTVMAQQIRAQVMAGNPNAQSQMGRMDDDALLSLVRSTHASPSCEIIALTVPTKGNQYKAVSMYAADESTKLTFNPRATALLQACGHAPPQVEGKKPGIYGDVFVGRCYDNEESDEWQRVNLEISEVQDPSTAEWCAIASTQGGGGGGSVTTAASLSGVMTQAMGSSSHQNGTWSQTDDEVELKFQVAAGTKAKYVKVNFAMNSLKVTVAGQTLIQGPTGGTVAVNESTFTIQDSQDGDGRELCVILSKLNPGTIWPHAVDSS